MIQTYDIPSNKVIVLRFNGNEVSIDEARSHYYALKELFPDNIIICLPMKCLNLELMDLDTLIKFRDGLTHLIDKQTKES